MDTYGVTSSQARSTQLRIFSNEYNVGVYGSRTKVMVFNDKNACSTGELVSGNHKFVLK